MRTWDEIEDGLNDPNPKRRLEAWGVLHQAWCKGELCLQRSQLATLDRCLLKEPDDEVRRRAYHFMIFYGASRTGPETETPAGAPVGVNGEKRGGARLLADWLWEPFKKPSAVFGLLDPNHPRDDEAKILLARSMGFQEYPKTEIHLVHLGDSKLGELLCAQHCQAVCLIGRLSLYGDEALSRWSNPEPRFRFPPGPRPEDLEGGMLSDHYHYISDLNYPPRKYATKQADGCRTDYGLVQRYTINAGTHDVVVVTCAGASSLGTLAATRWAAVDLRHPIRVGGHPMPAPASANDDSHLEVLLEVTAEGTACTWAWKPNQVKLLGVYLDQMYWSADKRDWQAKPPRRITIVVDSRDRGRASAILFDRKEAGLRKGTQMFRLLAGMCLRGYDPRTGEVDVDRMGRDALIWDDGKLMTGAQVRRHLSTLKYHYLGEALEFDGREKIKLKAEVEIRVPSD